MARLLSSEKRDDLAVRFGAKALMVQGTLYTNTAAKFWSSLVDELIEDHPECDSITLSAPESVPMTRELLFPQDSLGRDLEADGRFDLQEAIRRAIEEVELFGPPLGVAVTLLAGEHEIQTQELPLECVDTDVFSYLLAWLMEWCRLPEITWNDKSLSGDIEATDILRDRTYRFHAEFRNEHLSEGLYRRKVELRFSRS